MKVYIGPHAQPAFVRLSGQEWCNVCWDYHAPLTAICKPAHAPWTKE